MGYTNVAHTPTQDLKDAYFSELNIASTSAAKPDEKMDQPSITAKKKPIPKKKTQEDDPFASEDEADAQEAERKQKVQAKEKSGKRSQPSDVVADESDKPKTKKKKSTR